VEIRQQSRSALSLKSEEAHPTAPVSLPAPRYASPAASVAVAAPVAVPAGPACRERASAPGRAATAKVASPENSGRSALTAGPSPHAPKRPLARAAGKSDAGPSRDS